ncbi:MAG: YegS/Rv2252/BmrU family lipid kinase [Xenococcus sp. MO_188.B8]|nr:YegS/Rv2252/BmrU family lipid kinase [Xenococcus sp. MO_188.B8]
MKILLLAHDSLQAQLNDFIEQNESVLKRFQLLTSNINRENFKLTQNLPFNPLQWEELAVDSKSDLEAQILNQEIAGVIFLIDSANIQNRDPKIDNLLRVCTIHNIPLATNLATAELLVKYLAIPTAHLIFNPVSGQGDAQQELKLIKQLLSPHFQVNVHLTTPEIDAAQLTTQALETDPDIIIASGGDGTVSAVANLLINRDTPLGIIPRGTANAFSVALGIPTNIRGACDTIITGITRAVDSARCNGLPMILLTGIGFEAATVEKADREAKNQWGVLAYLIAGWQQLDEQQPFEAEIEIAGVIQKFQAAAITVANAAPPTSVLAQGGGQVIFDDGLLDITIGVAGNETSKLEAIVAIADLFGSALLKTTSDRDDVVFLRAKQVKITTKPLQKVVIDGEIIDPTPVEIECLPKSLQVFAPLTI